MITPPMIIGHRGASAFLPENTMESFRLAFEQGAPMIEFDVHTSKDRIPVIIHDAKVERTTNGKGYVCHYTAEELKTLDASYKQKKQGFPRVLQGPLRIPTLEEMLAEFKHQKLAVEIKENSAGLTQQVVSLIKKYGAESRCIVGSKYKIVSKTMRGYPAIKRFLSQNEFVRHYFDFKRGTKKKISDPQAVASMPLQECGLHFDDGSFIRYLKDRGIGVFYWTVNDPKIMRDLKKKGLDGIITDNPQLAKEVLED